MIKVYRKIEEIEYNPKTVLTVGTFDGVHIGHNEILSRLISYKNEFRTCIVTFHPHPQHVLGNKSPKLTLLTSIKERIDLFENLGIDSVLVIPFDKSFSYLSARDFISEILYKKLGISKFLIGYDHSFGKNREGKFELLKQMGNELNFEVEQIKAKSDEENIVSSTLIRHKIQNREIEYVKNLLGRFYFVTGIVKEGHQRGRTIGFPTANVIPEDKNKLIPGNGSYVVKSNIEGEEFYGMANIGVRPTFLDNAQPLLEVHFFNLDMNLYGKELKIEFLNFIREEKKFNVLEELVEQLNKDREFSINFLKNVLSQ